MDLFFLLPAEKMGNKNMLSSSILRKGKFSFKSESKSLPNAPINQIKQRAYQIKIRYQCLCWVTFKVLGVLKKLKKTTETGVILKLIQVDTGIFTKTWLTDKTKDQIHFNDYVTFYSMR